MTIYTIKYWFVKDNRSGTNEHEISAHTRKSAKLQFKNWARGYNDYGIISIKESEE